jgi:metacaspase-1
MLHGLLSIVLGLAISQLPELKPGTLVQITTGRDTMIGTIGDGGAGEFLRLQIASTTTPTYVRRSAIETIRILPGPEALRAAAAVVAVNPNRHLVYVHGICKHSAGFSKPWWDAMKTYTPQIGQANVHEVVWSDIVNPAMALAGTPPSAAPPPLNDEQQRLAETLRAILRDRAEQAEAEGGEAPLISASGAREHEAAMPAEARLFGGITEAIECANDFVLYMTISSIREQILQRFDRVVRPLLEGGAEVEIISHSWGTVIAYEDLRRLDAQTSGSLRGTVHNLFTVGSALSIGPVKLNLASRVPGGAKPQRVGRWVNIDAQFDVVGGHIQSVPFVVDIERLHLAPVGCTFPVTPTCAHGSYFNSANLQVNRDIFGRYIGQ